MPDRLRTAFLAILISVNCLLLASCSGDVETEWSSEVKSPDGIWLAIGRTDRHGGPGNAAVVTGIFIAPASDHHDEHLIFNFFDGVSNDPDGIHLVMKWLTPSHLQINLNRLPDVNYQVIKYGNIEISVQAVNLPE
jgi:hypothetical protein